MRTLEERITGPDYEPWIPENEGDFVVGELEEIQERDGDFGEYRVLLLWTPSGEAKSVAGFGTVLKKKFATLSTADLGCNIAVAFKGERTGKSGRDYKDFGVTIERKVVATVAAGDEFADDSTAS